MTKQPERRRNRRPGHTQEEYAPMQQTAYAADERGREVEQVIIIEILRADDGTRWTRSALTDQLRHVEPKPLSDALARLNRRGVIRSEGDAIEAPDSAKQRQKLDLLSTVVVHVLTVAHPRALTLAEIAEGCERDLVKADERHEIELALRWITGDSLACRQDDGWVATRPAVRAAELSF
jgi:thioesterase domain-containing protein